MALASFILKPYIRLAFRLVSWALYLVTAVAAFGGYISPHIWGTPSVLTLALPYFAVATFFVALVWLICRRLVMAGLGGAVLFLCSTPILMTIPFGHTLKPEGKGRIFTLMTYNVMHGDNPRGTDISRSSSFDYILASGADIVVLQELGSFSDKEIEHFPQSMRDSLFAAYPYRLSSDKDDLALLSKFPVSESDYQPAAPGVREHFRLYRIDIGGRTLHLANCHLESYYLTKQERRVVTGLRSVSAARQSISEMKGSILSKLKTSFRTRADEAAELRRLLDKVPGAVIVCGDFNDVPASWAYRTIMGTDLADAYCETNLGPAITFNQHLFLFHIDHILYRGPLRALSLTKGRLKASDHYPLTARFQFEDTATTTQ